MRSNMVKKGVERAPHRSLFKAMGYTDEEISKPLVGIVNSFNEIIPGHIHLNRVVEAVKKGVIAAGGTPIEFPTIGVCDLSQVLLVNRFYGAVPVDDIAPKGYQLLFFSP